MRAGIGVVIPTHPARARNGMLTRAVESVGFQDATPDQLVVEFDNDAAGAAATRTAGARKIDRAWTAFLDSDDWWYPEHLSTLIGAQLNTGADYLYSYFTVHDAYEAACPDQDPLGTFGVPFDPDHPTQTTITILVRTQLAQELGFVAQPSDRLIPGTMLRYGEDYDFTVRAAAAGARIVHVPVRTWAWRIHAGNSSGLSGIGDAPMPALPACGDPDCQHAPDGSNHPVQP